MAMVDSRRRGEVKWYVPSIAAVLVGVVAIIVVWILIPPAETVHVAPFDPEDDRREINLRLDDDATQYVIGEMGEMTGSFKIVNGKRVYEPVEVRGPVISIFRDVEYKAQFLGVWQVSDKGTTIRGTVTGTATVPWDGTKKPSADHNVTTNCKILDEHPKGRFLVEGKLFVLNRPILIGPGATIVNARTDNKPMTFLDTFGNSHIILPGGKATVDSAGQWIEEDDFKPVK